MKIVKFVGLFFLVLIIFGVMVCKDVVVLVYGNIVFLFSWDNIYNLLLSNGYSSGEIFWLDWGLKFCVGCNNYYGSEEIFVCNVIEDVLVVFCIGNIDVIGYFMGVMLVVQ